MLMTIYWLPYYTDVAYLGKIGRLHANDYILAPLQYCKGISRKIGRLHANDYILAPLLYRCSLSREDRKATC